MEEEREQPISEPATALDLAYDNGAVSENGSQDICLGKFKNAKALLDAYNNLQTEFTKKCQQLSELKKDKMDKIDEKSPKNEEKTPKNDDFSVNYDKNEENLSNILDENMKEDELKNQFNSFLSSTSEAENYYDEIKSQLLKKEQGPFERAWAGVILSHIKNSENKQNDPIINQYILSDENVKNKIIEEYLEKLNSSKPPHIMSSKEGERLSSVRLDSPKTLAEAKEMVNKMFS